MRENNAHEGEILDSVQMMVNELKSEISAEEDISGGFATLSTDNTQYPPLSVVEENKPEMVTTEENTGQFETKLEASVNNWLQKKRRSEKQRIIADNFKLQQLVFSHNFKKKRTEAVKCIFIYMLVILVLKEMLMFNDNEYWAKLLEPRCIDHVAPVIMLMYIVHLLAGSNLMSSQYCNLTRFPQCNAVLNYILNLYAVTKSDMNTLDCPAGLPVVIWLKEENVEDYDITQGVGRIEKPTFGCYSAEKHQMRDRRDIEGLYTRQQQQGVDFFRKRRINVEKIGVNILILTLITHFTWLPLVQYLPGLWSEEPNVLVFSLLLSTLFLHAVHCVDVLLKLWLTYTGFSHNSRLYEYLNIDRVQHEDMMFLHGREGMPFIVFLCQINIEKLNLQTTKILPMRKF